MIAEAVDAALLVADALAVWVLVGAAAGTSVVYAAVVGVWLVWRGVRRAWGVMPSRKPQAPASRPQPPSRASRDVGPPPTALREALSVSPLQTRPNRNNAT